MDNFYLIFDIIAVAVVAITVMISYKRGFFSTIILFVGYVASTVLAVFGGRYLSDMIYANFVRDPIIGKVHSILGETPVITSMVSAVTDVLNDFPEFIRKDIYSKFRLKRRRCGLFDFKKRQQRANRRGNSR